MNSSERSILEAIEREVDSKDLTDLVHIIRDAIALEKALYNDRTLPTGPTKINQCLFSLRKSLEGIFGCGLPHEGGDYDN
jgi:hypothetical protein